MAVNEWIWNKTHRSCQCANSHTCTDAQTFKSSDSKAKTVGCPSLFHSLNSLSASYLTIWAMCLDQSVLIRKTQCMLVEKKISVAHSSFLLLSVYFGCNSGAWYCNTGQKKKVCCVLVDILFWFISTISLLNVKKNLSKCYSRQSNSKNCSL